MAAPPWVSMWAGPASLASGDLVFVARALIVRILTVVLSAVWLFCPAAADAQAAKGDAQPAKDEKEVREEAEEAQRAMDIFLREQKVLIRRGELWGELDSFYSTDSRDDFIGSGNSVSLAKVQTKSVVSTLVLRYGLLNDLEADLRVPFVWAEQDVDFGVGRQHREQAGLGDVSASLRYQVWHERAGSPDILLSLEGKAPTGDEPLLGTGHWDVGATIAVVKTFDPVVLFARAGYIATLEARGRDPGDQVLYQMGIGYSLNERVSVSTQLNGAVVGSTTINGTTVRRSNLDIINLQFSVTALITRRLYVEPFVGVGLSKDAPDAVVGINILSRF
jgi:Putative MetA-pathway of phenol degradation